MSDAICNTCGKPITRLNTKLKRVPYKSNRIVKCTVCCWKTHKEIEEEKEFLEMIEKPKYTDRQLAAAFKLIEMEEQKCKDKNL